MITITAWPTILLFVIAGMYMALTSAAEVEANSQTIEEKQEQPHQLKMWQQDD